MHTSWNRRPYLILGAGIISIVLGYYRWPVGIAAWVAPVPFLVYLEKTRGIRSRALCLAALSAGFIGAAFKIITPPLVWPMAVLYGLSFGLTFGAGYLIWDRLNRAPSALSHLAFAAGQITVEWLLHRFTPLGSAGAAACTQVDNLPFLQLASLFGIAGIGFLMYWAAALIADGWVRRRVSKVELALLLSIIFLAHVVGAFRVSGIEKQPHLTVAAVGTDFGWTGPPLPSRRETAAILERLLERSDAAARGGAEVVAWPEVSAIVETVDETALIDRAEALAKKRGIHLVMAYLRLVSREPLRFENKAVWIDDHGKIDHTYLKHYPVPLEPSIKGTAPVRPVKTDRGTLAAAICYDFDFPIYARSFAEAAVDLVILPSSENLGMETLHPQIAAIRAIEGGYSILRPARLGRSAGIDPLGRIVGWVSHNAQDEQQLRVTLPMARQPTLYRYIGDLLVYLAMLFWAWRILEALRARGAESGS